MGLEYISDSNIDATRTATRRLRAARPQLQVCSSPPSVSFQGDGTRQTRATATDEFKMKDMKIETVIRNSEKADECFQVNPSLILKDIEGDLQKSTLYNNQEQQ
jgi:hypothetical protein